MIVGIIGDKSFNDRKAMETALAKQKKIASIFVGDANPVNRHAQAIAARREIPVRIYERTWRKEIKDPGLIRDKKIIDDAEMIYFFYDKETESLRHLRSYAKAKYRRVVIYTTDQGTI